jgi:hypothetical protein
MNKDDVIRMAREAGLHRQQHNLMSNPVQYRYSYDGYEENLEAFAVLVAAAEREACAQVADSQDGDDPGDAPDCTWSRCARHIAAAIRARGQQ